MTDSIVEVATSLPIRKNLYYRLPDDLGLVAPGMRVSVPVGKRMIDGIIIKSVERVEDLNTLTLKAVSSLNSGYVIPPEILSFYDWISRYYHYSLGRVIHEAIPPFWGETNEKDLRSGDSPDEPGPIRNEVELTDGQTTAVQELSRAVIDSKFQTFLLDGVTGSGKTEVYFRAIETCLSQGKSALYLVPEIGLTPQLLDRFHQFFGTRGLVYHSGLTPKQRRQTLHSLKILSESSQSFVLIGTRSAVLLPVKFDFIVVDEEHDASYKQNDHLRYNARDLAILRGQHFSHGVVLGSATPSLESHVGVRQNRIRLLSLPLRPMQATLPKITIVDLKKDRPDKSLLTDRLVDEIRKNLDRNEQTILFLNRRGFSPNLYCATCGHVFRCPQCDISLTYSKSQSHIRCHYCGYEKRSPQECPDCHQTELLPLGAGTERVEERIRELFPQARLGRFDRDTVTTPKKMREVIERLRSTDIDILIGTQMVAKGHDFPHVTLVGVLCADSYLHFPDFRASERTFQLLTQVSGRAGRADKPGRVLIQTFQPEHPAIASVASGGRDHWLANELQMRQMHEYPPYSRLALVRLESRHESELQNFAGMVKRKCPDWKSVKVLGPIYSPLARIKGIHRMQLLIKSPQWNELNSYINQFLRPACDANKKVDFFVDIDPQQLL